MSAQIGENHAIAGRQLLRSRQPQFMICGKRMQQNNRRAVAQYLV